MALSPLDIAVVVAFFAINLSIGLWYARGSGKNIGEYFLSGRSAPWWLTGTSMVATTFAVDTPLAVTGFRRAERDRGQLAVVEHGRQRNPHRGSSSPRCGGVRACSPTSSSSSCATAARRRRRLRGVRAVYQGVLVNTIIMAGSTSRW